MLKSPYGEALRKGTCTRLFAQCLVQWVLTWLCPLVAIAVQTINNKEVASSARVKSSYRICIVCMPLRVLGWMLQPHPQQNSVGPSSFSSGACCTSQNSIRSFPSFHHSWMLLLLWEGISGRTEDATQ